jgi:hypothetical protein
MSHTKPSSTQVKAGELYYGHGAHIRWDQETKEYVLSGTNHNNEKFERRYAKFKIAKQILKKL